MRKTYFRLFEDNSLFPYPYWSGYAYNVEHALELAFTGDGWDDEPSSVETYTLEEHNGKRWQTVFKGEKLSDN